MKPLSIHPPLINSSNPWCTTLEQLQELYSSPHTGAVTTRTSLLHGFPHDSSTHQFTFYNPTTHNAALPNPEKTGRADETGSLNTLGYSPVPLSEYLNFIQTISDRLPEMSGLNTQGGENRSDHGPKPFIISVTGTVEEVVECYKLISTQQRHVRMVLAMEVNLSCPNIPNKPPPAYNSASLLSYLSALKTATAKPLEPVSPSATHEGRTHIPVGIKTPPYTYHDQYQVMINALLESAKAEPSHLPCPVSFITATNTLGSSLLLTPKLETPALPTLSFSSPSVAATETREVYHHTLNSATGTGIGGLAGAPLHPIALGNVYTIKGFLFQYKELENIHIIGVGGVEDADGYHRMRAVGASAVGVGTALGRKGVQVFEEIGGAPHRTA